MLSVYKLYWMLKSYEHIYKVRFGFLHNIVSCTYIINKLKTRAFTTEFETKTSVLMRSPVTTRPLMLFLISKDFFVLIYSY